jgi:uncharacterized protein (TIGR03083 family)
MAPDLLAAVRSESARFADALAAADPGAPVPSCPAWTAADLAWHLTEVQLLWGAVVRERLDAPDAAQAAKPPRPAGYAETLALARMAATALVDALDGTADAEPVWTWFAPDRSVGFVRRRQAHEALIHRIDAEQTAGGSLSPVDPILATDGVDEVLTLTCGDAPAWATHVPDGPVGRLSTTDTGATWLVRLGRLRGTNPKNGEDWNFPALAWATGEEPAFQVSASAADLDAWLWNRTDCAAVIRSGDHAPFDALVSAGLQ